MNAIVCVQENPDTKEWGIGYNNELLFHYKEDMKLFRDLTIYKPVIMGRNTFESLPSGPLNDRYNIVLTSKNIEDVITISNLEELFDLINGAIKETSYSINDFWVIGGESIYKQLLPYCTYAYVTKCVNNKITDTYFPNLDKHEDWKCRRIRVSKNTPLVYYIYENCNIKKF